MLIDEIKSGESQNIEFKVELPDKKEKYIKTLVAYANTAGGKLVIGVEDDTREVVGVPEEKIAPLMDQITNIIADTIAPQLVPSVTYAEVNDRKVVLVEIFPGAARPYYIKSQGLEKGTYIRVNATTRRADQVMLKELQLQGQSKYYDETVIPGTELDRDKAEELCKTIKQHIERKAREHGFEPPLSEVTLNNLENWNVIKREGSKLYPTIAFDLLTDNHQRFAKIQCGLFKGKDKVVFIDKREFAGPVYNQIEEAYRFVLKHINLGAEIDGLYRREFYELPPKAIREAIANAVTHRNYMDSACIQVCVYDNRVEITSPGMLFGGLTIDMIKSGRSRIRNGGIAEVFSRMYVIEGWGTGIGRMINECREYGVQEPVFTEVGTDFRVEFFRKLAGSGETVNANSAHNNERSLSEVMSGVLTAGMYDKMLPIITILERDGQITPKAAEAVCGKSAATVRRYMNRLVESGIVTQVGSTNNIVYQLVAPSK